MYFDGKKILNYKIGGNTITLLECVLVWSFKDVKVFKDLPQPSKSQMYVLLIVSLLFSAPEKYMNEISWNQSIANKINFKV